MTTRTAALVLTAEALVLAAAVRWYWTRRMWRLDLNELTR